MRNFMVKRCYLLLVLASLVVTSACSVGPEAKADNGKGTFSPIVSQAVPNPPDIGSYQSGVYRNLFKEAGKTDTEIQAKLNTAWNQLFYGNDSDQRIYYPVGTDMAYIKDVGNGDVRSEGMSYGMMICVQLNKQSEFNKLWKWAKTYMYHTENQFKGYFGWQNDVSGARKSDTPASDGDEYFAMALFLASARWGDGSGIYNYKSEANALLDVMLHQADDNNGWNLFDKTANIVVFCPVGDAALYSDPSYVLPAFYEYWSIWATKDNDRWKTIADAGRAFFHKALNSTTFLGPDYANFDGSPKAASWDQNTVNFRYDAWRIAQNIGYDYAAWAKDPWQKTAADGLQAFFNQKGLTSYGNQFTLSGTQLSTDHSQGLVAMNAAISLAATQPLAYDFVNELWNVSIPSGQWRYYDGCLYFLALLQASGNYKLYKPDSGSSSSSSVIVSSSSSVISSVISSKSSSSSSSSKSSVISSSSSKSLDNAQNLPGKIEAENYNAMSGIQTEACSEGTLNVGWIDSGDWFEYNVNVNTSGDYTIEYRVASQSASGKCDFIAGGQTLASTVIPNTGGWQNWTTVTATVKLNAGVQTIRLYAAGALWNINWLSINRKSASSISSSSLVSSKSSVVSSSKSSSSISSLVSSKTSSSVSSAGSNGGTLKVQFYNGSTAVSGNQIYARFNLVNTGPSIVALSMVKIRYYYTKDGTASQSFWCDWSPAGSANVSGSFNAVSPALANADTYLEVSFASAAGNLAPGASIEVQARIAKSDWSNYNQSNDYSFNPTGTSYVDWNKVTVLLNGSAVWGINP